MKKGKKHIDLQNRGDYPIPGIPADDAWSNMKEMLDHQMPQAPDSSFNWIKAVKVLSLGLTTTAGLLYLLYSKTDFFTKSQKPTVTQTVKPTKDAPRENHSEPYATTTKSNEKSQVHSEPATALDHKQKTLSANQQGETIIALGSDKELLSSTNTGNGEVNSESLIPFSKTGKKSLSQKNTEHKKSNAFITNDNSLLAEHSAKDQPFKLNKDFNKSVPQKYNSITVPQPKNERSLSQRTEDKPSLINSTPGISSVESQSPKYLSSLTQLKARSFQFNNILEDRLIAKPVVSKSDTKPVDTKQRTKPGFFMTFHAGLLWNMNLPQSGYNHYFKGTNIKNDLIKTVLPGFWLGKTFSNGSEMIVKLRPYSAYFGGGNSVDTSRVAAIDSIKYQYIISRSLFKSSGFNLGIQYNQPIFNRWSIGIGANMQKQSRALLSNEVRSSRPGTVVDYEPFVTLSPKTDSTGYLAPHFFTGNVEALYTWNKIQIGAGVTIPITSMVAMPYRKLKPVSGQISLRWWIR